MIVAVFAEPQSLNYQVSHYFRESVCAQQDGRLDCPTSAAGQPQHLHQHEQHAEDQEVTFVALATLVTTITPALQVPALPCSGVGASLL